MTRSARRSTTRHRRPRTRATDVSLRAFHLLFIALSVTLAVFVAAWAGGQYRLEHEGVYALSALGAVVLGGGLAWYGAAFQRKTRHL